jgi:CRP-like cAMP-binding protein
MPLSNAILGSLGPTEIAAIRPLLKVIQLEQKTVLFEPGEPVELVYFPIDGVISLVVTLSDGQVTEAAMVGNDGVVGASSALDGKIAFSRAIMQLSGKVAVCDANLFKSAVLQSASLISTIIRHEQAVFGQAQQSTACMANHHVEARLSRWMLRARDLSRSDNLPFTQEFLAEMLGVQRTSVATVAHMLQQAGLIKYSRGKIQIVDVDGLRECACECYETVKDQYKQLLGPTIDGFNGHWAGQQPVPSSPNAVDDLKS